MSGPDIWSPVTNGVMACHMPVQPILLDARGLQCPLPALRLARAVREQGAGRYQLLADDPAAAGDIPALCSERGWRLLEAETGRFLVQVT